MSFNSSRKVRNTKKNSIYREVGSGRFIAIHLIDELEDIIDTSEAYMTDPTVVFNKDNTKVIFYYNTKDTNEIEEMETLFKRTVKRGSTITLSDAFYLDESSGDDTKYDLSGTYKFEKYDSETKTIIAVPISINSQSSTYRKYDSRYWLGSLLWTTADEIVTTKISHEIVNFLGNNTEHSFSSVFGEILENDKVEIAGIGTYTVKEFKVDTDEGWERIVVKEAIPEIDLLGDLTHISIIRSDRNQPKQPNVGTIPSQYSLNIQTSTVEKMVSAFSNLTINPVDGKVSRKIDTGVSQTDIQTIPNSPSPIPIDATWGSIHLEWFIWFIEVGVPFVVASNNQDPIESLDWRRLGFPQSVQNAWNILTNQFGYQWNIDTLNELLAMWGSGGVAASRSAPTSGITFHSCCDSSVPNYCGEGIPKCRNVRVPRGGSFRRNPCWANETYRAGPCSNSGGRRCCNSSLPGWGDTKRVSEYSEEECIADPNTHWMGSSATGYCMEGAEHPQQLQSTAIPRNLFNTRRPNNMGY